MCWSLRGLIICSQRADSSLAGLLETQSANNVLEKNRSASVVRVWVLSSPPPTEDDLHAFEGQKLPWVRGSHPEPEPPLLLLGCSRFPAPSLLEACCGRFPQRLSQGGDGGGEFPLQALTVFRGSVTAALLRLQEALACEWNAVAVEVAQRWVDRY